MLHSRCCRSDQKSAHISASSLLGPTTILHGQDQMSCSQRIGWHTGSSRWHHTLPCWTRSTGMDPKCQRTAYGGAFGHRTLVLNPRSVSLILVHSCPELRSIFCNVGNRPIDPCSQVLRFGSPSPCYKVDPTAHSCSNFPISNVSH